MNYLAIGLGAGAGGLVVLIIATVIIIILVRRQRALKNDLKKWEAANTATVRNPYASLEEGGGGTEMATRV